MYEKDTEKDTDTFFVCFQLPNLLLLPQDKPGIKLIKDIAVSFLKQRHSIMLKKYTAAVNILKTEKGNIKPSESFLPLLQRNSCRSSDYSV